MHAEHVFWASVARRSRDAIFTDPRALLLCVKCVSEGGLSSTHPLRLPIAAAGDRKIRNERMAGVGKLAARSRSTLLGLG